MNIPNILKHTRHMLFAMIGIFMCYSPIVQAANLNIAQTPLFLGNVIRPNVFFMLDDSGSMDWDILTRPYWDYTAYDPDYKRDNEFLNSEDGFWRTDGVWRSREFEGSEREGNFFYVFENQDSAYDDGDNCKGIRAAEACDNGGGAYPYDMDWRVRSSAMNVTYYNPDTTYRPWDGPCIGSTTKCADASFTAARSNPRSGEAGYSQLLNMSNNASTDFGGTVSDIWIDDASYNSNPPVVPPVDPNTLHITDTDGDGVPDDDPDRGSNFNYYPYPNNEVDLWDTHVRLVYLGGAVGVAQIRYFVNTANNTPNNGFPRGLNPSVTNASALSNSNACYNILGPKALVIQINGGALAFDSTGLPGCRTIAEAETNIANWYQYGRRRAFAGKSAISGVIETEPDFRYGLSVLNEDDELFNEVPDASVTNYGAHNNKLREDLFEFDWPRKGTPLRTALQNAGDYYDSVGGNNLGKTDPIIATCQKNFTVLFTDGFWNGSDPGGVGNEDGDGHSRTLADVAYKYYNKDLSNLANKVPADAGEDETLAICDIDPNSTATPPDVICAQHMVTFTVAFGVTGVLKDTDTPLDGVPNNSGGTNLIGSDNWGNPLGSTPKPEKIDDMWHAAFNSNGSFAQADTADEVTEKLVAAINAIKARTGAASAVALNSGTLNANSRVFQAKFDSAKWSGTLKSFPISDGSGTNSCTTKPIGEVCVEEWNAGVELALTDATSRRIITFNDATNQGVAFRTLADLSPAQQAVLDVNPDTNLSDGRAQERLDYLRGDDANEGSVAPDFRDRGDAIDDIDPDNPVFIDGAKMGDVIHSAPAFVGAPDASYPDRLETASYKSFRDANKNRTPIVYAGANDGMMHAFIAKTGKEAFAYVPGRLFGIVSPQTGNPLIDPDYSRLNLLTSQKYNKAHNYYVDGSPAITDVFTGSSWMTALVAPLGAGGQGVFALDITNPIITEASASNLALWEFTDSDDADLGSVIGEVAITRMQNGKWVAVFGNGFDNTDPDLNISATGNAAMYVIDVVTGALISKFDTLVGSAQDPTGGNRPNGISAVTPVDLDGDFKTDFLYAGDFFGNVWKIDVTSSTPSSWDFAYKSGSNPKPFHIARDSSGVEQAITAEVTVGNHPSFSDQTLVYFGTGKYFELGDTSVPPGGGQMQTFYAVWDNNTGTQYSRNQFLQQSILRELDKDGVNTTNPTDSLFRISTLSGDSGQPEVDWATHKGWYMDLKTATFSSTYGERIIVEAIIRGGRVIFVTLIPSVDPCELGGNSWIMELNAGDGSRLPASPFDVNGDGIIDNNDFFTINGEDTFVSGVKSKEGIVAKPGILNNPSGGDEFKYFSGTSGNIDVQLESINDTDIHRQSWRQIR